MGKSCRLDYAVRQFVEVVDQLFGFYLDCIAGFRENVDRVMRVQSEMNVTTSSSPDDLPLFFGKGDPNDSKNVMLHETTQGAFKERNRQGGRNQFLLGQYVVVLLYTSWEKSHRERLTAALGLEEPLELPLMGDLRLLRHEILHNRGRISNRTARRLKVIEGLGPGDNIDLDQDSVEALLRGTKQALDQLVLERLGRDPKHRTVWHVR